MMKSKISIEVDFDNGNQPVIQILQTDSDDVRDKLIKSFTQCLGGSSWCQIKWVGGSTSFERDSPVFNRIMITPIVEADLKKHAEVMMEQIAINESSRDKGVDPVLVVHKNN